MDMNARSRSALLCLLFSVALTSCVGGAAGATGDQSVKPGINDNFLSPDLDVSSFVERFEGDNREVFVHRARIASAAAVADGMRVADVGAGTGLFSRMFAQRVGAHGRVFAVEISERFAEHLRQDFVRRGIDNAEVVLYKAYNEGAIDELKIAPEFVRHIEADAQRRGFANVKGVLCTERSVELPKASVDLVFVCDTYHHFEYPAATLSSLHKALRPGGEMVIVDFERIPGVSRPWLLDHVRCGKEVVIEEIESAGFTLVREEDSPFLRENYILRFRRP